ncbi:hypothetical protein CAPTEDRAFT_185207, partial [Capitella teleta]
PTNEMVPASSWANQFPDQPQTTQEPALDLICNFTYLPVLDDLAVCAAEKSFETASEGTNHSQTPDPLLPYPSEIPTQEPIVETENQTTQDDYVTNQSFELSETIPLMASTPKGDTDLPVMVSDQPFREDPCNPPWMMVSQAGMIHIILKHGVTVEMTLDRAVRLINSKHRSVVAVNSSGSSACLVERSLKSFQEGSSVEICSDDDRFIRIEPESMLFASEGRCYRIANNQLYLARPVFADLSHDVSVTLLFSSSGYGPQLINKCQNVIERATFHSDTETGASVIFINGTKIRQLENGDAVVTCRDKYLRASPVGGFMIVGTREVNMKADSKGKIRVYQRNEFVEVKATRLLVSNRVVEGGFDHQRKVFIRPTPPRFIAHGQNLRREKPSVARPIRDRYATSELVWHLREVNREYQQPRESRTSDGQAGYYDYQNWY